MLLCMHWLLGLGGNHLEWVMSFPSDLLRRMIVVTLTLTSRAYHLWVPRTRCKRFALKRIGTVWLKYHASVTTHTKPCVFWSEAELCFFAMLFCQFNSILIQVTLLKLRLFLFFPDCSLPLLTAQLGVLFCFSFPYHLERFEGCIFLFLFPNLCLLWAWVSN